MAVVNHEYPVKVEWSGGRDGHGTIVPEHSGKQISIVVPPEFQGPGGETNPEELLTSAIGGCYSITYGIVATMRRLPFLGVETHIMGTVEQNGASFKYTSVVIKPTITLSGEATAEQVQLAEEVAHKCDSYCIVTNAIRASVTVSVEPTVVLG